MDNYVAKALLSISLIAILGFGLALALNATEKSQPNIINEQPAQAKLIGTVGDYKIYEIKYEGERYVAVFRHRAVAIIKHEPNRLDDQ